MTGYLPTHGFTPSPASNPFADRTKCKVMGWRGPCVYSEVEHDPDLPAADVDAFGYRRITPEDVERMIGPSPLRTPDEP